MNGADLSEHCDLCVGIDLGTTNSVLATITVKRNGDIVSKVVDIPRSVDVLRGGNSPTMSTEKRPTLPSCVYYWEEQGYKKIVGNFAKQQYPLRPFLVAKSIKSQMGKPFAENLSPDIPDKTPSEISARILQHMLNEASKIYRVKIDDAVITVPANFDSSMCKATLDAAELAGIKVRNSDGSERPVLLSEPNAVIYDLINQIRNGEISEHILDVSSKKTVMVFDIGGGTLDITVHEISGRENSDVLKVNEIATNRYTRFGGDDFDERIAEVMYERYLGYYSSSPEAVSVLRRERQTAMAQLRVFAENLKIDLNARCAQDYSSGWDEEDEEINIDVGGIMSTNYSYSDNFSKEDVERILEPFMARELKFDDYKRLSSLKYTTNIIYPILEVLKKAEDKLGTDNVRIDAVIVNGGMSKFYMITDRLKEFFGFEPIVALDPDQAVARGAAVYHYYLHKNEEIQDDMRMLGKEAVGAPPAGFSSAKPKPIRAAGIEWGKNILNDSLYLGVKNGGVQEIIPTGAELPYDSEVMTGFRIEPGQNTVAIPIKSRNIDGTYRTIASGKMRFSKSYPNGAFIAFTIFMGNNKVISMRAWTSADEGGVQKLEEGFAEISIDNSEKTNAKTRLVAKGGSYLQPKAEISSLVQLCGNYDNCRNAVERKKLSKRISSCSMSIISAGNKAEFGQAVLKALETTRSIEAKHRLFIIARKIGEEWTDAEKKRLSAACMTQLGGLLQGMTVWKFSTSTCTQAILALSICANKTQLESLTALHNNPKFLQACLYTHAWTKTSTDWLLSEFDADIRKAEKGIPNNLQFSTHFLGVALKREKEHILDIKTEQDIAEKLIKILMTGTLNRETAVSCILTIGWICDSRVYNSGIDPDIVGRALDMLENIGEYYPYDIGYLQKSAGISSKMLNGSALSDDEEQFLLEKLNK